MEGDFILQSIAEQGRAANEAFERKLKAATPLEILLETPDEAAELEKMCQDVAQKFADAGNPWDGGAFDFAKGETEETPRRSLAELEAAYPENPWGKTAQHGSAATRQDEERETPEVIADDRPVRERRVENMKACILSKMQDGRSRADVVNELLKIAGNSCYSRQIVRDAEMQTPE